MRYSLYGIPGKVLAVLAVLHQKLLVHTLVKHQVALVDALVTVGQNLPHEFFRVTDGFETEVRNKLDTGNGFNDNAGLGPEPGKRFPREMALENVTPFHFDFDEGFAKHDTTGAHALDPVLLRRPTHQFIDNRILRVSLES